jgi:hypothetical protein
MQQENDAVSIRNRVHDLIPFFLRRFGIMYMLLIG